MEFDIVLPQKNELELVRMAEKLGFKQLILFYEDLSLLSGSKTASSNKISIKSGLLIKNVNDLGKYVGKADYLFCPAERQFFENKRASYIICSPVDEGRDFFYQRRSELDDATCTLARQNKISLIFDIGAANDFVVLGRLSQDARLARKYKLDFSLATFARKPLEMRSPKDLDGLKRIL